ncbi:MAG: redox-regulated ATPase YchF [Acidimicrobiales bacterium]|nr:redox-regulated ATPase YchF [Acidimicrobiales bacterium]
MERIGIVGLPNSGKSSLFNALTGGNAVVASHPFSTTETSVGIAQVYDHRLLALAEMSKSKKVVSATIEFADQAGLVAGASGGEGLGNKFLAGIREVDAICLVLRAFNDENVVGDTDPLSDLETLSLELVLADATTVSNNLEKRRRAAKGDKSLVIEVEALDAVNAILQEGTPLWAAKVDEAHLAALVPFGLLTAKGVFAVVNIGDDQLDDADAIVAPLAAEFQGPGEVLAVSVQLEAEAAQLDAAGKAELLEGLGLGEGALPRVTRAAYQLLGRSTFLTTGEQESRAWTFRTGAKAPECAGVIHSDLQRGFIRAECIRWDELLEFGTWSKAKDAGKLRVEGKEYVVQDGDTLEIRFNV